MELSSIRKEVLPAAMDADYLRNQARQTIEDLASGLWTDYNSHDPGITIVEMLAYAITELGLRAQNPIENLLQNLDQQAFYSAAQILPNAALSETDYRRLLLGLDRVRDAQITEARSEVEGLYKVNILFEDQLSESWIEQEVVVTGDDGSILYRSAVFFVPPAWQSLPESWLQGRSISSISVPTANLRRVEDPDFPIRYFAEVSVTIDSSDRLALDTWIYTREAAPSDPAIDAQFRRQLLELLRSRSQSSGVFPRFRTRSLNVFRALESVGRFLNRHRNLSEDWERIESARIQQIAISIEKLELKNHADPVEVLANIFFQLQQFIELHLRPHSLDALLDADIAPSEIFQGAQLEPGQGFILEQDLVGLERGNNLYTSDILSLIMQVPGVFVLNGLSLRAFVNRLEVNRDVRNCMRLLDPDEFYPLLSVADCAIQIFRQGALVEVDLSAVDRALQRLNLEYRASFPNSSASDLSLPQRELLDVESYRSIQEDFPRVWGLRQGEITPDMSASRKAQAKQLKGYLLLFDQLMANYCSQLANIHQLFSSAKNAELSYFYQPLYGVPAVQNLFTAFWDEQSDAPLSWDAFTSNCNNYIKALNFSAEDQAAFRQRRQQFVEHLLRRFGEDFADYAAWVRVNNGGQSSSDLLIDQLNLLQNVPLLSAKRATAFNYLAQMENEAGETVADVWDTENVSGLQKRIAALLGMPDCRRRSLATLFDINDYREVYDEIDSVEDGLREARFRFWNAPVEQVYEGGDIGSVDGVDRSRFRILLSSTRRYPLDIGLEEESARVVRFAKQGQYYSVEQTQPTRSRECKYYINLLDDSFDTEDPIARRIDYPNNRGEVEQHIADAIHLMQGRYAEGMHVIEHVLLRPTEASELELLPVEIDLGASLRRSFVSDAYSFQVSIFLPAWAPRFRNREFRAIVEKLLRIEMPSHILPWIYWVELAEEDSPTAPLAFIEFENAYREWLESLANETGGSQRDRFVHTFNTLIREPYVHLSNASAYQPFSLER